MACVTPDGKPTKTGYKILTALQNQALLPEEVAQKADLPIFRVRSGLRELMSAGYVENKENKFFLTEKGKSEII